MRISNGNSHADPQKEIVTYVEDGSRGPFVIDVDKGVRATGDLVHCLVESALEIEDRTFPADRVY